MTLTFTVPGTPVGQGSTRAFNVKGRIVTTNKTPALARYRGDIRDVAERAGAELLEGPVSIGIEFLFERPKSHFGTGRNGSVLKASAPMLFTSRPDVDRCVRSCLDALTGICFHDDAQVVTLSARKMYAALGKAARTEIKVRKL